jgi:hypothetical protein
MVSSASYQSMQQIDIDSAFLNGKLDSEKYIRIPQGLEGDSKTHIGKLNVGLPLYGLAIAPMCWHRTITQTLTKFGFMSSPRQPCVFAKKIDANLIILILLLCRQHTHNV